MKILHKENKKNKILVTFCFVFLFSTFYCLNPIQNFEDNSLPTDYETREMSSFVETTIEEESSSLKNEVDTTIQLEETVNAAALTESKTTTKKSEKTGFGKFKSYTDYKCLSKSTPQWKLQEQAYTDENGLRKIGDAYLVALGSYYGKELGAEYTVILDNGNKFDIILCDFKQDRHTDKNNQYCLYNGSVLEFYVETDKMPKKVKQSGDISSIEFFNGGVVSIEKTA